MDRPLLLLGGGGHAQILAETLLQQSWNIIGYTSLDGSVGALTNMGLQYLGNDDVILSHEINSITLINGIGSTGDGSKRNKIFDSFRSRGYRFGCVIHPSSNIAPSVKIGEGAQIMVGAILQTGCQMGSNVIVNTGCRIDHHCDINDHCHIAPGATLAGSVTLGKNVHIGAGATVIQNIRIGSNSLVGAGSLVSKIIPENSKVIGIPARPVT